MVELMIERGYDRITISEILTRADVGRSTFYTHYRDKDDLLLRSCADYLRAAISEMDPAAVHSDPLAPVHTLFRLADGSPDVYRALLRRKSGAVLLRTTIDVVMEVLGEQLRDRLELPPAEVATTVTFLSWGVTGLLNAIAEADPPLSADEAYRRLVHLVGPGLSSR
ncbi:TetR/AcrR family transcriptional regulator [Nocardia beijingensis]|uniref:TetR/AcrR family transcriptional regulator n=1 Tax=Nocardia beijingensis TaxID=95162 RepID=A0ABW7WN93_9NOCA